MSLLPTLDAMAASGCSVEQIIAVVRSYELAREEKANDRRDRDAARKREERAGASAGRRRTAQDGAGPSGGPQDAETPSPRVRVLYCEESKSITPSDASHPPSPKRQPSDRGTRIPDDWTPDDASIEAAQALGLAGDELDEFVVDFREFWIGVPGARGKKANWNTTFRVRLRQTGGKLNFRRSPTTGPPPTNGHKKSASQIAAALNAKSHERAHNDPNVLDLTATPV